MSPTELPLMAWQRTAKAGWSQWHVPAVGDPDTVVRTACHRIVERARVRGTKLSTRLWTDQCPEDVCSQCWDALGKRETYLPLKGVTS